MAYENIAQDRFVDYDTHTKKGAPRKIKRPGEVRSVFEQRKREVVINRCVHGMSNEESALEMGISRTSFKKVVSWLLHRYDKQCMEQICFELGKRLAQHADAVPNERTRRYADAVNVYTGNDRQRTERAGDERRRLQRGEAP